MGMRAWCLGGLTPLWGFRSSGYIGRCEEEDVLRAVCSEHTLSRHDVV